MPRHASPETPGSNLSAAPSAFFRLESRTSRVRPLSTWAHLRSAIAARPVMPAAEPARAPFRAATAAARTAGNAGARYQWIRADTSFLESATATTVEEAYAAAVAQAQPASPKRGMKSAFRATFTTAEASARYAEMNVTERA